MTEPEPHARPDPVASTAPPPPSSPDPTASHRSGVLRVLTDAPRPLTSAEIAAELGVHKNTVRFHLESLITSGQVEQAQVEKAEPLRSRPGRPAQVFRAVPRMDPTGPRHYELLAGVLTDALLAEPDGTSRAVAAGRAWGSRAAAAIDDDHSDTGSTQDADPVSEARARLVGLLDRFGFAPDHGEQSSASSGPAPVAVRQCPFLELAEDHQRIICGVHLGLMRGALAHWKSALHAEALEPFVEPDRCLVRLGAGPEKGDEH